MNLSESNAMFAVFADDVEHTNKVLNGTDFEYTLTEDCAKVSVVGSAMRGVPGVMAVSYTHLLVAVAALVLID